MNMISKMLLTTLSILALGACSSTKDMEAESTESLSTIEQIAEDKAVQTDMIEVVETLSEEELMVQQYGIAILKKPFNSILINQRSSLSLNLFYLLMSLT
ncbi:hypothetical protein ACLKMH_01660 [Psychromonas sp. KJ10-10]|uniref:hypothetical protein n=1 Tax=Psychromonas sp. KJ10-10 TaxID=3391823 RepID=UPI0039B5EC88